MTQRVEKNIISAFNFHRRRVAGRLRKKPCFAGEHKAEQRWAAVYIYNGSERGKRTVSCPWTAQRERAAAGAGGRAALQELAGQASLWPRLMSPLLDAAPAQCRSGGPLHVLLRERRAAQPGA